MGDRGQREGREGLTVTKVWSRKSSMPYLGLVKTSLKIFASDETEGR